MEIQFWDAAQEVTGSCFLVRCADRRVLVDGGLIQGDPVAETRHREPFPFEPASLDAVVLSHAHLDHSGRLPLLAVAGYRGPIYTHRASRDLRDIMLRDAAYLNEKDPYTRAASARAAAWNRCFRSIMRQFRALEYADQQEILPGVRLWTSPDWAVEASHHIAAFQHPKK